ncbi:MAG: maltose ABC transporter substrate-binding protein [Actinobacteria bacterium]|nr:maltose ABC transporter substrate-binding protein [Actinomycetota bacterium]
MLSACGSESSESGSDESAAAEGGESAAAPDAAESTEAPVRDENADLVIWSDNVRAPVLQEYADQFGQEFDITAKVQVATDVRQQFKDATNVGEGPDIIVGAHDWLGELVQDGTVAPIQMSSDVEGGFTPESVEATKFNGQTYGVPYAFENLALIRNTDMAAELPATMEALVATGREAVDAGNAEAPMVTPVSQQGDAYHAFPYLSAYGGGIFGTTEDGGWDSQNVIIDSPETIKGGEKISMLAEQGALNVSVDGTTAEALFTAGDSPFFVTGPWSLPAIQDAGINYEVSPIPEFEDGGDPTPFLGVQMFYVSAEAANPTLAQEFVNRYVPTPEFQMAMYEAGGRPPALQETLDAVAKDNPDIEAFAKSGEGAQPMPNIPAMNAVWGPLGVAEVDIVEGAAAAERLPSAQQEIVSNIE